MPILATTLITSKAPIGYTGSVSTVTGPTGSIGYTGSMALIKGVFFENDNILTSSHTISTNKNAMSTGPITINSSVTVTIPSGSRWVVL